MAFRMSLSFCTRKIRRGKKVTDDAHAGGCESTTHAEFGVGEAFTNLELLITNDSDVVDRPYLGSKNLIEILLLGAGREISDEDAERAVAVASDRHINEDMLPVNFGAVGAESLATGLNGCRQVQNGCERLGDKWGRQGGYELSNLT